jgi:4-hydroxyphenylacetate 3-monooxygenase
MLMTGKEYLQSIRDGRVIYVGKERVKDQTTHPAFADGARTYAALFDMKSDPAVRDLMTFEEDGECYSMYYLQPRSQEDLRRRNRAHRKIADFCFGLMGRTPDAFAGNLTGLSLKPEVFGSVRGLLDGRRVCGRRPNEAVQARLGSHRIGPRQPRHVI